jgi:hypothetical protein
VASSPSTPPPSFYSSSPLPLPTPPSRTSAPRSPASSHCSPPSPCSRRCATSPTPRPSWSGCSRGSTRTRCSLASASRSSSARGSSLNCSGRWMHRVGPRASTSRPRPTRRPGSGRLGISPSSRSSACLRGARAHQVLALQLGKDRGEGIHFAFLALFLIWSLWRIIGW